ncbi:hypothetical protein G6F46_010076 [Rhizopus delemar]|nr:hypothetical protein G6F55_009112 [Rhizopus delemar]KAG1546374.1 hypothetical protein G6F51_004910 [Rhizopus arrhizus]KAG1503958.1 hypothetical protein G6F53_010505 [Rhizopus delemar]KAG1556598.1 hypothetical protein G6F49_006133 [Rhizopus delemar]KAG1565565.1 hypothetical protein G6F50_009957 [Rhizopus delemar]
MRDSCVCGYFGMRPLVLDEQDEFLFEDDDDASELSYSAEFTDLYDGYLTDSVVDELDEVHVLEFDGSGEKALYEFEMSEHRELEVLDDDDDLYRLLDSDYFEEDGHVQFETTNMDDIQFDDEKESLI